MKKQSICYKIIAGILLCLLMLNGLNATQINVGGNINDTVTWNADTINVTSNIIVGTTGSLTISSTNSTSQLIIFQGQFSITVQGSISAAGKIVLVKIGMFHLRVFRYLVFTYKSDTTGFSDPAISSVGWSGINLQAGSKANFRICEFKLAKSLSGSLFSNSGNAAFTNCKFHDNKIFLSSLCGILYSSPTNASDSLKLSNSSFYNNYSPVTILGINKFNISGNSIYNNTNTSVGHISDQSALSISNGNGIISNNKVYNNSINGINITWTTNVTLDRNYIYNNKNFGITFMYSILTLTNNIIANNAIAGYVNGTITAFINNTVAYNHAGINFVKPDLAGGSDAYFYNTIIWNNNSTDLSGNMNIYVQNCLLPYTSSGLRNLGFSVKSFKQNLNVDPQFLAPTDTMGWNIDAASANWSLSSNSPCINTGTTITDPYSMPTTDYAGTPRVKHGFPDIGAYELSIGVDSINTSIINSPTMWVADTVKVFNNVTVIKGGKLTIAPGTVVSFQDEYYLEADTGTIIAKGTVTDSIVFTRQNPILPISDTSGIFWQGINIQTSTDSAIFQYCRFEFAEHKGYWKGAAINVDYNDKVSIKNSLFRFNVSRSYDDPTSLTGDGAAIAAFNSDITINQCQFTDNLGSSTVFVNSSNVAMSNCYFTRNMNDLKFSFATDPIILNTITRSYNSSSSSNPAFVNCEFYGNKQMNLYSSNPRFYNSVCFNNISWSDQSKPTFFNCMYNNYTYPTLSGLTVNPYLPTVSYLQSFVWDEGNDNYSINDYKRNSFYPSINKGTTNLPAEVSLPSIDIQGNPRIIADTIDIGAIEQQGQLPVITKQPFGGVRCLGKAFTFSLTNVDTAVYQWQKDGIDISGASLPNYKIDSIDITSPGGYQCILQNGYGTITSNSALLQIRTAPDITDQPSGSLIIKNEPVSLNVQTDGSQPLSYLWSKDGIDLPDSTSKLYIDSFKVENEGDYICNISNNCGSIFTDGATISLAPSICMVTVDVKNKYDNGHNLIIWDKESKVAYKKYKIYRESDVAGYYDSIGSVPADNPGIFEDTVANPKEQAYLYKITAVNLNNIETDINAGQLHKTIHLLVTKGEQGGIQLDWDQYIGFPYSTYFIYRSNDGTNFGVAHTMASSTRTWTDDTVSTDTLYYYIAVKRDSACNPSGTKLKAGGGIYGESVSNMEDNRLRISYVANASVEQFSLNIYPNPFSGYTTISYLLKDNSDVTLELYNLVGEKVSSLINTKQTVGPHIFKLNTIESGLNSGIYLLKFKSGNNVVVRKLIQIKK